MQSEFIRYLLGFLFFILILSSFVFSNYLLLLLLSIVFIMFSVREYRLMFKSKNIEILNFIPELIGIILAVIFVYNNHDWATPVLALGVFLTFFFTIIGNKKPYIYVSFSTIMCFLFIFCTLYIIKLFYFMQNISLGEADLYGAKLIITYFLAILAGDFIASKVGPKFKNKLLSPQISPNKTFMGAVSNLIASCCVSCLLYPVLNILECLFFGIVISVFSQIGDLTISLIKRDLEIKHSSNLFAEYGGILDRVDAFIFSAPAAYYCLILIYLLK